MILTGSQELPLAAAGPAGLLHARGNLVPRPPRRLNVIQLDGLRLVVKRLADGVSNPRFLEDFIIRRWFVQNHAQRGPGSAALGQQDADRCGLIAFLEVILHHGSGLLGYLKHLFLLFNTLSSSANVFLL